MSNELRTNKFKQTFYIFLEILISLKKNTIYHTL